jgi:hypothetical protein
MTILRRSFIVHQSLVLRVVSSGQKCCRLVTMGTSELRTPTITHLCYCLRTTTYPSRIHPRCSKQTDHDLEHHVHMTSHLYVTQGLKGFKYLVGTKFVFHPKHNDVYSYCKSVTIDFVTNLKLNNFDSYNAHYKPNEFTFCDKIPWRFKV